MCKHPVACDCLPLLRTMLYTSYLAYISCRNPSWCKGACLLLMLSACGWIWWVKIGVIRCGGAWLCYNCLSRQGLILLWSWLVSTEAMWCCFCCCALRWNIMFSTSSCTACSMLCIHDVRGAESSNVKACAIMSFMTQASFMCDSSICTLHMSVYCKAVTWLSAYYAGFMYYKYRLLCHGHHYMHG